MQQGIENTYFNIGKQVSKTQTPESGRSGSESPLYHLGV